MNKIKQNKINFTLILVALTIIFSSLTILSLPVLFNYESKVTKIEKNFHKNFKIYLKSSGKISYKPFPKPHLLVENASLRFSDTENLNNLINTKNLRIFISLRDIYLRLFKNFISTEILYTNLEIKISDIKDLRKHLYQKVNKPIIFTNCKIFLKNKSEEVILISPIKKILYKIDTKSKIKSFKIDGEIFGLVFKSEWKRDYENPKITLHNINTFNPNIEIKNILKFIDSKNYEGKSLIAYAKDKLAYDIKFNNGNIKITSPNKMNTNFNIDSKVQLYPFDFNGSLMIKNKKVEDIIDSFLINFYLYDKESLGNLNGVLKINFSELKNKLIKKGSIDLKISEKKINLKFSNFYLDKIGNIETVMNYKDDQGDIKFISSNKLNIQNHIEFAKVFQIGSKKAKNIKQIYFNLEKKVGETDFIITNVKINNNQNIENIEEIFLVKNIQNLRSHIRKIID